MSEDEPWEVDIVPIEDENGDVREFGILALVELDEGTFAVLAPAEQLEGDDPEFDLYAFRYIEHDDGIELDAVEDDALVDRITAALDEMMSGEDDDGDDD